MGSKNTKEPQVEPILIPKKGQLIRRRQTHTGCIPDISKHYSQLKHPALSVRVKSVPEIIIQEHSIPEISDQEVSVPVDLIRNNSLPGKVLHAHLKGEIFHNNILGSFCPPYPCSWAYPLILRNNVIKMIIIMHVTDIFLIRIIFCINKKADSFFSLR